MSMAFPDICKPALGPGSLLQHRCAHHSIARWQPGPNLGMTWDRAWEEVSLSKTTQAAARRRLLVLEGCFHRKGRSSYLSSWKAEQTLSTGFLSLVGCHLCRLLMAWPAILQRALGSCPLQHYFPSAKAGHPDLEAAWLSEEVGRRGCAGQGTPQKGSRGESRPLYSLCAGPQKP